MKLPLDMTRCLALYCPNAPRCERFQQRHLRGPQTNFINNCAQNTDKKQQYPLFIAIGGYSPTEHAA